MRIVPHRPSIHAHTHAHSPSPGFGAARTACPLALPMRDDTHTFGLNVHTVFCFVAFVAGAGAATLRCSLQLLLLYFAIGRDQSNLIDSRDFRYRRVRLRSKGPVRVSVSREGFTRTYKANGPRLSFGCGRNGGLHSLLSCTLLPKSGQSMLYGG